MMASLVSVETKSWVIRGNSYLCLHPGACVTPCLVDCDSTQNLPSICTYMTVEKNNEKKREYVVMSDCFLYMYMVLTTVRAYFLATLVL